MKPRKIVKLHCRINLKLFIEWMDSCERRWPIRGVLVYTVMVCLNSEKNVLLAIFINEHCLYEKKVSFKLVVIGHKMFLKS